MAKYKITTEDGSYIITTEEPAQEKGMLQKGTEMVGQAAQVMAQNPAYKYSSTGIINTGNAAAETLMSEKVAPFVEQQIGTVAPQPVAKAAGMFTKAAIPAIETLGQPGVSEGIVKGVQNIPAAFKKGADTVKNIGKWAVKGKQTRTMEGLSQELTQMPVTKLNKTQALEGMKKSVGSDIEKLRGELKTPQKLSVKVPKDLNSYAENLKEMTPEHYKDLPTKQLIEKIDEVTNVLNTESLTDVQTAFIQRGKTAMIKGLAMKPGKAGELGAKYGEYGDVAKGVKKVPEELLRRKTAIKTALNDLAPGAKREQWTRGLVGTGATVEALRRLWKMGK